MASTSKQIIARRLRRPIRKATPHAQRVARKVNLPARVWWPYALPGASAFYETKWRLLLKRAPVVDVEDHVRSVGMKDIEEVVTCTLCNERRCKPLFNPREGNKWSYHIVRCVSCGFLYRSPGIKPERLGELYAGSYDSFLTGKYAASRKRRYRLFLDAYSPLFDEGNGRRLLDFGCGAGLFLEMAHERGFDCYGVDLSPTSIEKARTKPGGQNTYFGSPKDVPEIAAGGFDVITLWSVLAHLPCPIEDFEMLRGLLAPGGVLLILTVNAHSMSLKADGAAWNGFTKNHLKIYSPKTLPLLLRKTGFESVVFRPSYGDTIEAGTTMMRPIDQRRLRRNVDRNNRGNMMRAVAFTDAETPRRWGFDDAIRL